MSNKPILPAAVRDLTRITLQLSREAQCVPWGFSLLRFPDTLSSPIVVSKVLVFLRVYFYHLN